MALASVHGLTFTYPEGHEPALSDVSLTLSEGEVVLLLGPSGSGKSTLLRALAGLVPHFHGGRFEGEVEVAGRDTRRTRPAELAGTTAILFQDPEDQIVLSRVESEVAFGLENLGTPPGEIAERALAALGSIGAEHLAGRRFETLSGGELQRVCLASVLALEPRLLLLDEPTSQLDPEAADALVEAACSRAREQGTTVVLSEQRPALPLDACDRVLFMEGGRVVLDSPRAEAADLLPAVYRGLFPEPSRARGGEIVCRLDAVSFDYGGVPAVDDVDLELRRGEVVALTGPNGSGKTTLAKLAAGLVQPSDGLVFRVGRAAYLSQDPGRYLFAERVDEEVALAADLEQALRALDRVGLAGHAGRHPRDLSSGERERLALAAVLVIEPDLLVLDEPTRGVDPERKAQLAELLRSDAPRRATLVVTHDASFAGAVSDRTVSLPHEREAALV